MHSTSTRPSHSERGSGLPRMSWPLSRIRVVLALLPVLFPVRGQRGRSEQRRRVRQQREAKMVASLAKLPDLRDVFLCHAWDDRQGAAKELHGLLDSLGVSVLGSRRCCGSV
jgi:hypothetical protein